MMAPHLGDDILFMAKNSSIGDCFSNPASEGTYNAINNNDDDVFPEINWLLPYCQILSEIDCQLGRSQAKCLPATVKLELMLED